MSDEIKVTFEDDDDSEKAKIFLGSFGAVDELRFQGSSLDAVAHIDPVDIRRLLEAFRMAEEKRVSPDPKTLEALDYLHDRFDYQDEDKSRLRINCEFEMPIAGCGSIKLEPNFERQAEKMKEDDEE